MNPLATRIALACSTLLLATALHGAPDAQSTRTPQFDNDAVNVWRSTILPNAPLTFHRHDHPRIIVALNGGQMKFVEQSGHIDNQTWETDKAYYLPAMPPNTLHEDVNAGDKPIDVMVIELKHEQ